MRKLLYVGLMMIMLLSAPESKAQEEVGIVELHVEALAGGATFTFPAGSEWSLGVDFSAGKHLGVDVLEVDDDIDLFGVGYAVVSWRPDPSWQVSLSPAGLAAVAGNDFTAVYPSGRLGIGHFWGQFGVGTEFRVVRIAGANGTGEYWMHWAPVRVSMRI